MATLARFVSLISWLREVDENKEVCNRLSCTYKPVSFSNNEEKKKLMNEKIEEMLRQVYAVNREDVLTKDFSFLKPDVFVVDEDIGPLYMNVVSSGSNSTIKSTTNELLSLFHGIMNDEDKKTVESRFKKPKKAKKKSDVALNMEDLYAKNADTLKAAENDPSKMGDVMENLIKNNGKDLAKAAKSIFDNLGLDLGEKKKR